MEQVLGPLTILALIAAVMLVGAAHVARKTSRRATLLVLTLTVLALLAHALFALDHLNWTRVLPVADCVIYSNVALPLAGVLVAFAWRLMPGPVWQRWVMATALLGIATWRTVGPLLRPAAPLREPRWTADVCRQSSLSSCSAAAGATVLRACGIDADEAEMARLCLTNADGTSNLGLYRGLRIRTGGTDWQPIAVRSSPGELRARGARNCLFALRPSGGLSWRDRTFAPGRHTVVLFGFYPDGSADIGDPFSGRQRWPVQMFDDLWPGEGLALVRRS